MHCLERITGKPVRRIEYHIESMRGYEPREVVFAAAAPQQTAPLGANSPLLTNFSDVGPSPNKYGLNSKYIFETFIV